MTEPSPLLIGVTGNIGTGKSTVAGMLRELGATVIDADLVARGVMRAGTPAYVQIVQAFGTQVVGVDGEIDRKELAAIVFVDPAALAQLEANVHPPTVAAIRQQVADAGAAGTGRGVVVVEAIKLIEAGMADLCDSVWVVDCRAEQQIERVLARDLTRAEAEQRVRSQSAQAAKIARADVVVDNSGSLARTRAQVRAAWERLTGDTEGHGPNGWPRTEGQV